MLSSSLQIYRARGNIPKSILWREPLKLVIELSSYGLHEYTENTCIIKSTSHSKRKCIKKHTVGDLSLYSYREQNTTSFTWSIEYYWVCGTLNKIPISITIINWTQRYQFSNANNCARRTNSVTQNVTNISVNLNPILSGYTKTLARCNYHLLLLPLNSQLISKFVQLVSIMKLNSGANIEVKR